jgi:hypothetical protein
VLITVVTGPLLARLSDLDRSKRPKLPAGRLFARHRSDEPAEVAVALD